MILRLEKLDLPLAHFDLRVDAELRGAVIGVFGPSGAGKTSLLDAIAGLRRIRSGAIRLDDTILEDSATQRRLAPRERRIGYVPQDNALFPHRSVAQNIDYGRSLRRRGSAADGALDADEMRRRAIEVAEIGPLLGRDVTTLSGGEQKRVALARALITAPRLLLLDEPLAGLDRPLHNRISGFLRRVRDEFSVPMVYVTHDPAELLAIADETLILERGTLVGAGRTGEVLASANAT